MRNPTGALRLFLLGFALAAPAWAGGGYAGSFSSPNGLYRVDFTTGTNATGTDVKPMAADIVAVKGGETTHVTFKLIRYSEPTTRTVQEAFRFSPDETAVAIENRPTETKYGFRMIPLKAGLPWKAREIVAIDLQWVDADRLVYRGDAGNDGFFIGVFDARSGRTRIAHADLSRYVSYEITDVTPATIKFHESTRDTDEQRCYVFNTNTGVRSSLRCPR